MGLLASIFGTKEVAAEPVPIQLSDQERLAGLQHLFAQVAEPAFNLTSHDLAVYEGMHPKVPIQYMAAGAVLSIRGERADPEHRKLEHAKELAQRYRDDLLREIADLKLKMGLIH